MPMGGMMPPGPGIPPLMPGMPPGIPPLFHVLEFLSNDSSTGCFSSSVLNRPPAPTATVPAPRPPVTKPLFPSAGQAQAAVQGPVGTFKPLNSTPATTTEPPKPTFPAYTQSTASTTSITNSTVAKPAASITSKPATLTTTSATSRVDPSR